MFYIIVELKKREIYCEVLFINKVGYELIFEKSVQTGW